jgi:hypothetical protein
MLRHSLPELAFVTASHPSRRLGELSVAASAHRFVIAEYAGPGECAFARIVDQGRPESVIRASSADCSAATEPSDGWRPVQTA